MGVNPKLPPDQKKLALLGQISDSLQNISSNMSHEMGPFKVRPIVNPSDEMAEQWEKNEEVNRRETEISELKRSNKIARMTTIIAVAGLLLSAIIGVFQFGLDWMQYQDQKSLSESKINLEISQPE